MKRSFMISQSYNESNSFTKSFDKIFCDFLCQHLAHSSLLQHVVATREGQLVLPHLGVQEGPQLLHVSLHCRVLAWRLANILSI